MFLNCRGAGDTTVIFDAGLGNDSSVWSRVQPVVADFAFACVYDRAGVGMSDPPPPGRRSSVDAVADLDALIAAARLPPPYLLVGASFGGLNVRLLAAKYPAQIKGLVFVDALHPDFDAELERILTSEQIDERRRQISANPEGIDFEGLLASDRAVRETDLPSVPVTVLTHGLPFESDDPAWPQRRVEEVWLELQKQLAEEEADDGKLVVAAESHHRIHVEQAEVVVEAIHDIVAPGTPLPSQAPDLGSNAEAADDFDARILFSEHGDIWSINGDGSDRTLVIDREEESFYPRADPTDPDRIVYLEHAREVTPGEEPDVSLRMSEPEGSNKLLAHGAGLGWPAWSTDGHSLAFALRGSVWIVPVVGGPPIRLADGGCPVWRPGTDQLAICTVDGEINLVTVDGGPAERLTDIPGADEPGVWSASGDELAFFTEREGSGDVWIHSFSDSEAHAVTSVAGSEVPAGWLPDGRLLVASNSPDTEATSWYLISSDGMVQTVPALADIEWPVDVISR
jgi:hypothetical protein